MADLKEALVEFDRIIHLSELDAERMLTVYGATPEEITTWRRTELKEWKAEAARQRREIIRQWFAGAAAERSRAFYRT
jgi:hypothetical protein